MGHELLVVEDCDDVREPLALILLLRTGHRVVTARHGGEAMIALEAGLRPCLIFLDLWMPEVDGFAFRQRQLANPALREIPTVVMTALDLPAPLPGVLECVRKPILIESLVDLVTRVCHDATDQPLPHAS